ncbi:MAG: cytochrome c biogenesis protein CcdA [bacterium]
METNIVNTSQGLSFALVFMAGLLSTGTPCVLSMIPIVLTGIGAGKHASRRQAARQSASFALGIIVSFTALGLFFGLTGKVFGSFMASPGFAIGVAAIFVGLAGSAFGLYEISIPTSLATRFSMIGSEHLFGGFAAGLVAGFIALPCIGPILFGLLAYVGTGQDTVRGALLLMTYSLGFSLPFFLVGSMNVPLPRRGPWMLLLERLFGVMLLIAAHWFLRPILPESLRPASFEIGFATFLLGAIFIVMEHLKMRDRSMIQLVGFLLAVIGGAFTMNAAMRTENTGWCIESGNGNCIEQACAKNTVTVVDFNAEWCVACKGLEKNTLQAPSVRERMNNMGRVKVDIDIAPGIAERFGVKGVPDVAFLDHNCKPFGERIRGDLSPEEFLKLLPEM